LSVAFRSTDFSASLARSRAEEIVATDGELLVRFVRHRDHGAFAKIVERHGRLVWMICSQVLRHHQDVEDALQATFLILAERAQTIRASDSAAAWLFGVAQRTALAARRKRERRREETLATDPPAGDESLRVIDKREMLYVLMQEIECLPHRYQTPLVMRYLEGQSRRAIAEQTDSTVGQIQGRLVRGRRLLRSRFLRRGVSLSLAAGAAAGTAESAEAAVTPLLIDSTAETCLKVKNSGAVGGLSPAVLALVQEGVKAMWMTSVAKCAVVVSAAILVGGAVWAAQGNSTARSAGEGAATQIQLQTEVQGNGGAADNQQVKERGAFLAGRFKYKVPVEIGSTEFKEGGQIKIEEVWGTRPRIEVGGQYIVRGKYVLPRGERGKLYFYETANGEWGTTPTANMDLQAVELDKETGEFQLVHGMAGPGNFHLYLASPDKYSRMFANVYFGTGDNVLRPKQVPAAGQEERLGLPVSLSAHPNQSAALSAPPAAAPPTDSKMSGETAGAQQTSALQARQLELERDAWRLKAEAYRLKAQDKKTTLATVAGKNIIPHSEESQGRADVMLMEAEAKLAEAKEAELGAQLERMQKANASHDTKSSTHQESRFLEKTGKLAIIQEAPGKTLRPGDQIVVARIDKKSRAIKTAQIVTVDKHGKLTSDSQPGWPSIEVGGMEQRQAVDAIRKALEEAYPKNEFRVEGP
jgi:RNA polymerase sigma factor (sigma-70 family)